MSITLNHVSFNYPGESRLIIHLPFWKINSGEKVFLHGPSGCGKSTLLGLLSGMLTCTSGEITVLNQRLDRLTPRERDRFRAQHIGYVFQQFNLLPYLNPIENLLLAKQFGNKTTHTTSHIIKEAHTLFDELNIPENIWHKPCQHLSQGQQQRIAIARALINKPSLFIADEPTSSLDQNNQTDFIQLLMKTVQAHNITLLFVSHDTTLTPYFERHDNLESLNIATHHDFS